MRLALPFVAACALTSCVFVLNENEKAYETRNYTFDGSGVKLVEVHTYNGSLVIDVNLSHASEVNCDARFYATGKTELIAQDRLLEMTVIGSRDGDTLRLEVPKHTVLGTSNVGARLKLDLPEGVRVDLRTSNGNVEFESAFDQPIVRTSNGNVNLRAASGPIKVRTSNGRVDIQDWDAPAAVEVRSSNGGIDYLGGSMDFELVTSNGPVHLELPAGWNGKGYIHSSNSNVHIQSKGRLQANLKASTSNGRVSVSGPEMDGEGTITVETSNGTVQVDHKSN
jgi:putative adhesin